MLLEARNIKLYIGDRLLIDIERLHINRNERIGLVGRNGSGKTTLLQTLAGKMAPDEGKVTTDTTCELLPQLKRRKTARSSGEVTQEYIRQALSKNPGILLLDEPTTHLDTNHIEWLEKKLFHWPGAFVVVSHDRAFLDALCTTIWEIHEGHVRTYAGNYTEYAKQKEIERQQQRLAYEKYVHKKKQLEEALRLKEKKAQRATKTPKQTSASEAKLTGAKPYFAKKQKKLQQTAKAIKTRLDKLEKVEKMKEEPPIKMNLPETDTLRGRIVLRAKDVPGTIGERTLWERMSFEVRSGDKLAVMGPNGSGKTTLVKKIIRREDGISVSPAVKMGYFSQDLGLLDTAKSILDNVRETSKQDETIMRTVLARLQFFRDDVYKPIHVLSGGERVKAALAKVFLSDINMLILDEPTNFLDIPAVEALESLLKHYAGTVIFVTHDRRFAQNIANRILIFQNGQIDLFEGTYEQYERHQRETKNDRAKEEQKFLLDTKISEVLSRLSIDPSEELEEELEKLLAQKKKLDASN